MQYTYKVTLVRPGEFGDVKAVRYVTASSISEAVETAEGYRGLILEHSYIQKIKRLGAAFETYLPNGNQTFGPCHMPGGESPQ